MPKQLVRLRKNLIIDDTDETILQQWHILAIDMLNNLSSLNKKLVHSNPLVKKENGQIKTPEINYLNS